MPFIRIIALLLCLQGLVACASFGVGRKQAVLFQSEPERADVLSQKGEKLGETTHYLWINREKVPKVQLQWPNETQSLTLKTHYRWQKSFFANFVFIYLAPIGWAIDLLTGAAWEIEPPPLQTTKTPQPLMAPQAAMIAIAPPRTSSFQLSDEGAKAVEAELRAHSSGRVILPYEQTLPTFLKSAYDFDINPEKALMPGIFAELKADAIFESHIEEKSDHYELIGEFISVHERNKKHQLEVAFYPQDQAGEQARPWWQRQDGFFHFLPNTVKVDFSNDHSLLQVDGVSREADSVAVHGFGGQILESLSDLGLSHLQAPRAEGGYRFRAQFIPSFSLSYRRLRFSNIPDVSTVDFARWHALLGYGPEVGLQSGNHYFYLNYIPSGAYTYIEWDRQGNQNVSKPHLSTSTEFGYLYFATQHWSLRFFNRTVSEDETVWSDAIHDAGGANHVVLSSTYMVAGVSLGYVFNSEKKLTKWRLKKVLEQ